MPFDAPDDLIDAAKNFMGGSAERVSDEGFDQAAAQAQVEVGFTYPIPDGIDSYWALERIRRHAIYILMVESAHKFQYKQIHIEHRFKHYIQLIDKMDKEWAQAMDDNPEKYGSTYSQFCHFLDAGFVYNALGTDITYLDD